MIVQWMVVREKNMLLRHVGHAPFAYHGVFSVVDALMRTSLWKHLVWNCFAQVAGSHHWSVKRNGIGGNRKTTSFFMVRVAMWAVF